MNYEIERCLNDLEARIDAQAEESLIDQWMDFYNGKFEGEIFTLHRQPNKPMIDWPKVTVNETLTSYEKMALQQFKYCSDILASGSGSLLNVRCNYGTGILTSVFNAEIFMLDDEFDTLPITKTVNNIRHVIENGLPDINNGFGSRVFEMGEYFKEIMKPYPKIKKHVHIYHPDLQGPMDMCELLWGNDLFLDVFDEPELVHQMISLLTQTYINIMDKWIESHPFEFDGYSFHWGTLIKGKILLRDDSAMNYSPEMYDEFFKPYNELLLQKYGGGIHFCGRGDHFIKSLSETKGLNFVNYGQPELNDNELLFKNTVDKGIVLLSFDRTLAENSLKKGRNLHSLVTCL